MTIRKYTYTGGEELYLDVDQLYVVTVTHPNTGSTRRFIQYRNRTTKSAVVMLVTLLLREMLTVR